MGFGEKEHPDEWMDEIPKTSSTYFFGPVWFKHKVYIEFGSSPSTLKKEHPKKIKFRGLCSMLLPTN